MSAKMQANLAATANVLWTFIPTIWGVLVFLQTYVLTENEESREREHISWGVWEHTLRQLVSIGSVMLTVTSEQRWSVQSWAHRSSGSKMDSSAFHKICGSHWVSSEGMGTVILFSQGKTWSWQWDSLSLPQLFCQQRIEQSQPKAVDLAAESTSGSHPCAGSIVCAQFHPPPHPQNM